MVSHIEIFIDRTFEVNEVESIFYNENRLQRFVMFNFDENQHFPLKNGMGREIVCRAGKLGVNRSQSSRLFSINIPNFTESQNYHNYFNQKIYIGPKGEIKNAPECEDIFGNILDLNSIDELNKIISKKDFQKYWTVNADLCDVCKICEFRYMCVDNRIPTKRSNGSWYYKEECSYNPYIGKWRGEEGYKNLEESGVSVNDNKIVLDKDKIKLVNQELWA